MIENLCSIMINSVEKVVGRSLLRWNCQSPDLYPSYDPPLLSTHLTNPRLKMGPCLKIEDAGREILTVCWESARSESIFIAESIGKDVDNVSLSTDDPKNEFDA